MRMNKNNRISYSDAEKLAAHNMSTLDYLQRTYGFSFAQKGRFYVGKEHDSLIIYGDEKGWAWNSRGLKGADVISFIQQVENMTYVEALQRLLGTTTREAYREDYKPAATTACECKELLLPEKAEGRYNRVYAYLVYTRRLAPAVVNYCFKNKSLYQDNRGNCVFVGYDNNNKAAYGAVRGTLTDVKYRGDCTGSNKEFGFKMINNNASSVVYVFESPIDAMSHATIANIVYSSDTAFKNQNRLALGGLNTVHLDKYLKDNPQVRTIKFCLDNDCNARKKDGTVDENHGQKFAAKCCELYKEKGYEVQNICPKTKDFNDDLIELYCNYNNKQQQNYNNNRSVIK